MRALGVADTMDMILVDGKSKGVLCVPGGLFQPSENRKPTPYIRVSYSLASPENIEEVGFYVVLNCL